jgi:hypothetical protein
MSAVLNSLALESVSIDSRSPADFIHPNVADARAVYFNANANLLGASSAGDPRFERDHEGWATYCHDRGVAFCIWVGVPRTTSGGKAFAQAVSAKVESYGGMKRVDAVMFDNEKTPLGFQDEYVAEWDRIRPFRPTLYSVEPFQDSTQNRYAAMVHRNDLAAGVRKVTFQCYQGGMQPLKPRDVYHYLSGLLRDEDLCPTIDPAQPGPYIASAAACGLVGLMLFSAEREP